MAALDHQELEQLERRELQLTMLSVVFVLILATGLAAFMYPLVFVHPEGNKWTMRVAFFGFCALTLLFVGYLLDHQRTVRKLKQHLLAEVDRNIQLRQQAGVDLLKSMPDVNHFWDRLTMEFRRASTMEKNLSLVLIQSKSAAQLPKGGNDTAALSEAAKLISRKLRPSDSLYRLSTELFALVLPETDLASAKRITVQLQEELQIVRATHGRSFHLGVHNYPQDVSSAHELEDLVRDLLPEKESWSVPLAAV